MATAGSFSGYLVDSFMSSHPPTGPFGQPLNISSHGPMSFAPSMHGSANSSFGTQQSFFSEASFMEMTEESVRKIATMQAKLNKKLGPEYISQRPGPGGGPKLTYAEGWKIINLANEVFGFNGWSSNVVNITTDFMDYNEESRRYNVGVTAIVRVTLRDGVFHEDVGYGLLENSKSKGAALDKCKKEAVTDAVKRTLRNFGNLLGNCLYDKSYTQEVIKIKVPPPKFERSELHRRPEFEESKPAIPPTAYTPTSNTSSNFSAPSTSAAGPSNPRVKSEPITNMPPPPSVPPHHPQNAQSASYSAAGIPARPTVASTPNAKGKAPMAPGAQHTGLQTPLHTPGGRPAQGSGGDRMAQNLADRHAARLRQIQEAQDAQRQEEETARARAVQYEGATSAERRVSFAPAPAAEPTSAPARGANDGARASAGPAPARASPPQIVLRSSDTAPDMESDEYHFPSEDDAFLASLDLEALDEGIGRPIDFEEGTRPDVDVDAGPAVNANTDVSSAYNQGQRAHQEQQQRMAGAGSSSNSGAQVRSGHAEQRAAPARFGQAASTGQGGRARTPSMGGGFNFAADDAASNTGAPGTSRASSVSNQNQNHPHGQPRAASTNASAHQGGAASSVSLKRSADIMQGYASAQAPGQQRRPAQGMGLQHAGAGAAGAGAKREPFASLEVAEGGSVKRPRR